MTAYSEGDRIESRFGGGEGFFAGVISKYYRSITYDVLYDDGDHDENVQSDKIRILSTFNDCDELDDGTSVESRYGGGNDYFRGKISKRSEGELYDVKYDDGDFEANVPRHLIRPIGPKIINISHPVESGTQIQCLFRDGSGYFPGKVTSVKIIESYDVLYDDGDSEKNVAPHLIRRTVEKQEIPTPVKNEDIDVKPLVQEQQEEVVVVEEEEEPKEELSPVVISTPVIESLYCVDEVIEARYLGGEEYYRGTIINDNNDGTWDIRYEDDDEEKGVSSAFIRKIEQHIVEEAITKKFITGTVVEARYMGGDEYFRGTVTGLGPNNTYIITYEDGDIEHEVKPILIRHIQDDKELNRQSIAENEKGDVKNLLEKFKGSQNRTSVKLKEEVSSNNSTQQIERGDIKGLLSRYQAPPSTNDDKSRCAPSIEKNIEKGNVKNLLAQYQTSQKNDIATSTSELQELKSINRTSLKSLAQAFTAVSISSNTPNTNAQNNNYVRQRGGERRSNSVPIRAKSIKRIIKKVVREKTGTKLVENIPVGVIVEALFREEDQYFPGQVIAVNDDDTFDILFDDGDSDKGITKNNIRVLGIPLIPDESTPLSEGMRIQSKYNGGDGYFPGFISLVNSDGTVNVKYDDGDEELDLSREMIRILEKPKPIVEDIYEDVEKVFEEEVNVDEFTNKESFYTEGVVVEVKTPDLETPLIGKISKSNIDGTFAVDFDNGTQNNSVQVEYIQPHEGSTRPSSITIEKGDVKSLLRRFSGDQVDRTKELRDNEAAKELEQLAANSTVKNIAKVFVESPTTTTRKTITEVDSTADIEKGKIKNILSKFQNKSNSSSTSRSSTVEDVPTKRGSLKKLVNLYMGGETRQSPSNSISSSSTIISESERPSIDIASLRNSFSNKNEKKELQREVPQLPGKTVQALKDRFSSSQNTTTVTTKPEVNTSKVTPIVVALKQQQQEEASSKSLNTPISENKQESKADIKSSKADIKSSKVIESAPKAKASAKPSSKATYNSDSNKNNTSDENKVNISTKGIKDSAKTSSVSNPSPSQSKAEAKINNAKNVGQVVSAKANKKGQPESKKASN